MRADNYINCRLTELDMELNKAIKDNDKFLIEEIKIRQSELKRMQEYCNYVDK